MKMMPASSRYAILISIVCGGCDCGDGDPLNRLGVTLRVEPESIDFGTLAERQSSLQTIRVINDGMRAIELEMTSAPPFIVDHNTVRIGSGRTLEIDVRFTGGPVGDYLGKMMLVHDADRGPIEVPLHAMVSAAPPAPPPPPPPPPNTRRLCVTPTSVHFGSSAGVVTREVTLEACGDLAIEVGAIDWSVAAPEIDLQGGPPLPLALQPRDRRSLVVRYQPVDQIADRAVLSIRSNDQTSPSIEVEVTGSADVIPEEVGRFLYFWRVTEQASNIVKLPLQGGASPQVFWGESTGQGCPGCHQVSPDGRYVAIVELDDNNAVQSYMVDTRSSTRITLPDPASHATGFSWRPDVTGSPPYRFTFASGARVHLGALFDGYLGQVPGANDPSMSQGMPSWSSDGRIAFVRGELDEEALVFVGPSDIYVVPETGGAATPLSGASANGRASYYPAFSPNARWLAFTDSNTESSYAAPDARVRLVRADGSGMVLSLDRLNGTSGATSFPSWAIDGTHLSVSSNRAGGRGDWDIYVAPIDPQSGADGPVMDVPGANTPDFEHAAQWSP